MNIEIKKLSCKDGEDIYQMLCEMPAEENGFINGINGKTYEEYEAWLRRCEDTARGIGLKDWMVPQTTYWLYVEGLPVGMGKIRHRLTQQLREEGGHCGYAIRPTQRGKGYGKMLLAQLRVQAKALGISEMLLTIRNANTPSIKVALGNGGVIEKANDVRHYIWVKC